MKGGLCGAIRMKGGLWKWLGDGTKHTGYCIREHLREKEESEVTSVPGA